MSYYKYDGYDQLRYETALRAAQKAEEDFNLIPLPLSWRLLEIALLIWPLAVFGPMLALGLGHPIMSVLGLLGSLVGHLIFVRLVIYYSPGQMGPQYKDARERYLKWRARL